MLAQIGGLLATALLSLIWAYNAAAIALDLTSDASIKSAASQIAYDMMTFYKGNESGQTPGILPGPPADTYNSADGYFWWEAGGMWGCMIDYWYYTGDSTYNDVVTQALLFQTGENLDYMPRNQTFWMGNDDQGMSPFLRAFWGMSAMTAAESNFPNPPPDQAQWLALAQGVFNTQLSRFDNVCGGGLRWQLYLFAAGYQYKNAAANGCFFNIASRLACYTNNATYAQYAESTWDWMRSVGLIDAQYNVWDGVNADALNQTAKCGPAIENAFSYNYGVCLLGAAMMYNYTNGSPIWRTRVEGLLNATYAKFFPHDIGFEADCEATLHCLVDQFSFKAFLTRAMAGTAKVAPFTYDSIFQRLRASATAAAQQCSGGPNGRMCGMSWSKGPVWDGTIGVGQQMAAMEVILSNLVTQVKPPLTNRTGGTSVGNPGAGIRAAPPNQTVLFTPPTTADTVGASFLTAAGMMVSFVVAFWIIQDRF